MSKDPRILNITRGFRLKRSQAERAVNEGACVWVEYGVSVRNATLQESIAMRNFQAQHREPIASAEIPGLIWDGPPQHYDLIRQANQFAEQSK